MTAPLRDWLAKILASARPSIDFPAWGPMERDRDHWREIADALLASEEWRAWEAVVETGTRLNRAIYALKRESELHADEVALHDALARLDAMRGKEPDDATDRPA